MRDPSVFAAELDATMGCTMARCEVDPHRFQPENRSAESEYVGNYPTSIQAAQMSQRPDHGYRGRFSSRLTPSYPHLHPAQSYTRVFTMPTMGRNELEQRLHNLRKNIRLSVQFETNEPQKAPDKSLELAGRHDRTPSHYAVGPSRPNPIDVAQTNCEQNKGPWKQSSRSIPIRTVQDGGNLEATRGPRP